MINLHTEALSSFWALKVFHTEGKGCAQEEAISGFHTEILIFCFNLLMLCLKSTKLGAKCVATITAFHILRDEK